MKQADLGEKPDTWGNRDILRIRTCLVAARCILGPSIVSSETVAVVDVEGIRVVGLPTVSIFQLS